MDEPIGARLRQLRKDKEWTQTALAYHSGRAPTVISQVETGKRQPELSTVKALAGALEVDWRYLLLGDEFPKDGAPRGSGLKEGKGNPPAEMLIKLGALQVAEWEDEIAGRVEDEDQEWFDRMQEAYFLLTDLITATDKTGISNPAEIYDQLMRMANFAQTVRETADPGYEQRFESVLRESGEQLRQMADA